MVVYRVWNNHPVNYVKNDISIMHFVSSVSDLCCLVKYILELYHFRAYLAPKIHKGIVGITWPIQKQSKERLPLLWWYKPHEFLQWAINFLTTLHLTLIFPGLLKPSRGAPTSTDAT
jgi:hypothetical protein